MFRDAARIGQIAGTGAPDRQHRAVLEEALTLFDQAAMLRLAEARLSGLPASLAGPARHALASRDGQAIRRIASNLQDDAPATGLALQVAGLVVEGAAA